MSPDIVKCPLWGKITPVKNQNYIILKNIVYIEWNKDNLNALIFPLFI